MGTDEIVKINVPSLRYALNSCKSSLDYSITQELIGSVSDSNVWFAQSQKTLVEGFKKMIDVRYKNLEEQIDKYMNLTSSIEKYQNLKKQTNRLDLEYQSLNDNLYRLEREYYMVYNEAGEEKETYRMVNVKDYYVEQQMQENRRLYNENKIELDQLKSIISGSI